MGPGLSYREWEAPPSLRAAVRCVWSLVGDATVGGGPQPIVPDGCPEIVLNVSDPFRQHAAAGGSLQPRAMLVGQATGPTVVEPTGRCRVAGIRLQPWAGRRVVGIPMSEVRDRLIAGVDLPGSWIVVLHERLAELEPSAWAPVLFGAVEDRLRRVRAEESRFAAALVDQIARGGGRLRVSGLADRFGMSERTVQRVLRQDVGLPPTALARILRLQRGLSLLLRDPSRPLGRVALWTGYYDQAHFTREFQRLVGCAPSDFLWGAHDVTDHFVSGAPAGAAAGVGRA